MKHLKFLMGLIAAVVLAGCVPTRFAWSPDGKWMTVISDDGLRISDANGNFLPGMTKGVSAATWLGDSSRLVVVRQIEVRNWAGLTKYLSEADANRVAEISGRVTTFADSYNWHARNANSWDAFQTAFGAKQDLAQQSDAQAHRELAVPVGIYLREHLPADARRKIPPPRLVELMMIAAQMKLVEVCPVTANGLGAGKQIMTSLKGIHDLRVSPTGTAVAITIEAATPHDSDLYIAPADGSRSAMQISDRASWYPDWSPDGGDLIFIRANQTAIKDEGRLGKLTRQTVLDKKDALAAPSAPVDLLSVEFSEFARVRSSNGRILCAMADMKIPAKPASGSDRLELFALSGKENEKPERILNDKALALIDETVQYFEASPDGQHISIPAKSGKVYVFDQAGQNMIVAQGNDVMNSDNKPELMSVPQWRSPDELTFVGTDADGWTRVELWSMSTKTSKDLSASWPADLVSKKATTPSNQEPAGL